MERPTRPRRSSILSQAAEREGYDVSMDKSLLADLAKAIPQSVVSNAARLSGSIHMGRRSSAASGSAPDVLPTPINKLPPIGTQRGSSTLKKNSSIPRPVSSKGKQAVVGGGGVGSSGRSRLDAFLQSAVSATEKRRSRSMQRDDRSTISSRSSRMTRASSSDSLNFTSQTAPPTPSSRFLKSPGNLAFPEKTDIRKTLKPPGHKDVQALAKLAKIVKDFMIDHQCPEHLVLDPGKKMSLSQYSDACRFLLQCLFGPTFMKELKQDELSTEIIDASNMLQYPGILTKSVLKSPNSEHTWPSALTFLAFLCARIDAALTPPAPYDDPLNEIKDPAAYSKVILVESYRNLFCQAISGKDVMFEEELECYRGRLRELHNRTSNVQEVNAQLEELQSELERRAEEEDPRKELLADEGNQKAIIENLEEKEAALSQKLSKYQDLETVEARHTTLAGSLESAKTENEDLDRVLAGQTVDFEKRKELVKEIESLKKQRELVEQVNETAARSLKNREQYVANAQQRFYDVCCRLNVSNTFNEHLQKLELLEEVENMERMKNTPFDQVTFKSWLKATRRVHRHAKSLMTQLQEKLEECIAQTEIRITRYTEMETKREDALRDLKLQVESLRVNEDQDPHELEDEMIKLKLDLQIVEAEINELAALEVEADRKMEELDKNRDDQNNELASLVLANLELEKQVQKLLEAIEKLNGPVALQMQKLMVEQLAVRRAIIKEDWGVDILKDTEKTE